MHLFETKTHFVWGGVSRAKGGLDAVKASALRRRLSIKDV